MVPGAPNAAPEVPNAGVLEAKEKAGVAVAPNAGVDAAPKQGKGTAGQQEAHCMAKYCLELRS